jgi:hypothetical protein
MKPHSSKLKRMLLLILVPLFIASGCQPLPAGAPIASLTPPVVEKTFEANIVFGSGPFTLPDTTAGLSDFSSYKATLTLAFDGTKAGQPSKWSKVYVMLAVKEPAARQLTIEKTGDFPDLDAVFMAERDGADYERHGQKSCIANPVVEGNSLAARMEPAGFLGSVIGGDPAGSDTVNGVKASHYTFDERALGLVNRAKSMGEVWVADAGGYIVKYLLTTKATADYFGEGTEGTFTWDYELTDLNKPVTITLPADCPAGMVNAPQLPDATNVVSMPGVLTYDTPTSLADVAAFYQKQLPTSGWKLQHKPDIAGTTAVLNYQKDGENMSIIVKANADVTSINILLERAQK